MAVRTFCDFCGLDTTQKAQHRVVLHNDKGYNKLSEPEEVTYNSCQQCRNTVEQKLLDLMADRR